MMALLRPRGAPSGMDADSAAAWWFVHLRNGPLSARANRQFELWLTAAPENAAAFARIETIWEGSRSLASDPNVLSMRAAAFAGEIRSPARTMVAAAMVAVVA